LAALIRVGGVCLQFACAGVAFDEVEMKRNTKLGEFFIFIEIEMKGFLYMDSDDKIFLCS